MTDRVWFPADYSQGRIDGNAVVLIRGCEWYPTRWTQTDLPWRIHATCIDLDDARRIANLLNEATS